MANYQVGAFLTRCFIQKRIELRPGVSVIPLSQTGTSGEIHDTRHLLDQVGFPFLRRDFEKCLAQYRDTGQTVVVLFSDVEANSCGSAIDSIELHVEAIAGSLAVVSANPVLPLCAYAKGAPGNGVKFYIPCDRIIRHGTHIQDGPLLHGFLDVLPDLERAAASNSKLALLLRLYRASLREREPDYQILFQLVLLEEASDNETGGSFAARLRSFSERHEIKADLDHVAIKLGLTFPEGKDVIDVLVKLRNAAAHNGKIDEESLRQYGGDWVIPIIDDKSRLHKLVGDALRYMFCCFVGHNRDAKATTLRATEDNQVFQVKFD
ncbi:MAG: hypothetical protein J0M13_10065 [Candidatus Accumulibacter sp.]|nr:hypothetical protein [Candidatus Accumulibacter necessarius]